MEDLGRVIANNYSNKVTLVETGLIRFFRTHHWSQPQKTHIDVFSRFWSLAFIDGRHSQIAAENNGQKVLINDAMAIFIPPFSIVKWHIISPTIEWMGYYSDLSLQNISLREPVMFPWHGLSLPDSHREICEILKSASHVTPIGMTSKDVLATRIKGIIDQSYHTGLSVQDLAKDLGYDKAVLIRRFKQSYGVSPVQYRLKLQLAEAIVTLMTESLTVGQVAHKIGFNDISFFNKVFKRELNATPSNFLLKYGKKDH